MSQDPWMNAGDFGHPNKKFNSIRFASDSWWSSDRGDLRQNNESNDGGLYDRASAALSWGSDSKFARLVQKFMSYMR